MAIRPGGSIPAVEHIYIPKTTGSRPGQGKTNLEVGLLDVDKAGLLEALALDVIGEGREGHARLSGGLGVQLVPLGGHGGVGGEGVVVAADDDLGLGGLDPAAGLGDEVGLAEELGPVLDGAEEVADVDKVEQVVVPGPFSGAVVDLEAQVRGHPGGLDRREVGADDLGGGELVGKVAEGG